MPVRSLSPVLIGRVAAIFFLVAAAGTLVPGPAWSSPAAHLGLFLGNLALGVIAWLLPWARWSPRATLWLVPLAFGDLAAAVLTRGYNPLTLSMYYVVVFVWVGVAHPAGTALKFAPLAGLAYIVPMYLGNGLDSALAAAEVVPGSVAVGECLAWLSGRLRSAEARDDRRVDEMRTLVEVAEQLARMTDPDAAPVLIAKKGAELLRAEATALWLTDDTGLFWSLGATSGWPGLPAKAPEPSAPPVPESTLEKEPLLTLTPASALAPLLGAAVPFASVTLLALRGLGRVRGVLAIARPGDLGADSFERQIAIAFARQAGALLDRVEAVASLQSDSLRDQLTGLANRRFVDRRLPELRAGDALAVLDLDHFKELNDSKGHAAGDDLLRRFAGDIEATLRDTDFGARLGGDEFLLFLPGAGLHASIVVDRLRARFASHEKLVGFSAGIAIRKPDETPSETLKRADQALYEAKRGGRGITAELEVPAELRHESASKH